MPKSKAIELANHIRRLLIAGDIDNDGGVDLYRLTEEVIKEAVGE